MGLEKAIKYGKEHRKPYYRSKQFSAGCCPGGACGACNGNRMYSTKKAQQRADYQDL